MKKVLLGAILVGALVVIGGCTTTTENEVLQSPGTLTYQVVNNGYAIQLNWDAVTDADGYYVYFNDAAVDTIDDKDSTTIIVDQIGVYKVAAYKGDIVSDPTNSLDFRPVETSNVTIYDASVYSDTTHPSGAGWDVNNGTMYVYPLTDHCDVVDLFYYSGTVRGIQTSQVTCPNSPDSTFFNLVTPLRYGDVDSVTVEPTSSQFAVNVNDVYTVKVVTSDHQVYYGKIQVIGVNDTDHSVTLKAALQTHAGLKRVGNAAK